VVADVVTSYGNEEYTPDTYTVVSRPASNKKYRTGVLLNSKGDAVHTCGHTSHHTSSKAAIDCMRAIAKGTKLTITN
jgi:hypothetical protein